MKKFKKANNKGFSLVEIIVVLVIMAILVAVSIPALTGYIEDATGKGYMTEARTAYISAQAYISEKCALGADGATVAAEFTNKEIKAGSTPDRFNKLMKDSYTAGAKIVTVVVQDDSTQISEMQYEVKGYTITIKPGSAATVEKN